MINPFTCFNNAMRQNIREFKCIVFGHAPCRCRKCIKRIIENEQYFEYCTRCGEDIRTPDGKGFINK